MRWRRRPRRTCPPRLRGDLSKWLCEINTGVYVGNVSSRVRDAVWDRVCQNLKNGQATLVYTAAGEQRMEFRTHNTSWEAVDFDGIKRMRRPLPQTQTEAMDLKPGFSKAAKYQMAQKMAQRTARKPGKNDYTVIDLETTGLHAACTRNQKPILTNRKIDLLPLARRKVIGVANFKLLTLIRHFGLADRVEHRALPDCRLTQRLYAKLNETGTGCN